MAQLEEDIVKYYESCQADYSLVWHLKSHLAMHYGYWEHDTKRLRDALWIMNEKVADLAEIKAGDKVLDAGCGVGGSAIYLARTRKAKTHGITLSQKHVDLANAKAAEMGLAELASFSKQNYCETDFPDASFDVVWAIESVCHAPEKSDFIREAYRILKPGGRLVVADFFKTKEDLGEEGNVLIQKWADSWAVPDFETSERFYEEMVNAGFQHTQKQNITDKIMRSVQRLKNYFIPGLICDGFMRMIGKRTSTEQKNMWSTYYQYKSMDAGLWQYYFFLGKK